VPRRPLADKGVQTSVRLPRDLYDRLTAVAGDKGIGEEIRQRLEASFASATVGLDDPRFRYIVAAIEHAAAAAAKMPYQREVPYRAEDGAPRRDDDKTPYAAFREAVTSLMDAFEPEGPRLASDETLIRLTDQLVGLALGTLGDRGLAAFTNRARLGEAPWDTSGTPAGAMAPKIRRRGPEGGA
jgi:hypothetical protein